MTIFFRSRIPWTLSRHNVCTKPDCLVCGELYNSGVPKLWTSTIDAHRQQVRDAVLDGTAALIAERGLLAVGMSLVAERAGIGRATLYKYFPDIEAVLLAWHERQVASHLEHLERLAAQAGTAMQRLGAVLTGYALIARESHTHPDAGFAAFLHRGDHVSHAQHALHHLVAGLIAQAVNEGAAREDVAPEELANYCLHALNAASTARSKPAANRIVTVTLGGLRPPN